MLPTYTGNVTTMAQAMQLYEQSQRRQQDTNLVKTPKEPRKHTLKNVRDEKGIIYSPRNSGTKRDDRKSPVTVSNLRKQLESHRLHKSHLSPDISCHKKHLRFSSDTAQLNDKIIFNEQIDIKGNNIDIELQDLDNKNKVEKYSNNNKNTDGCQNDIIISDNNLGKRINLKQTTCENPPEECKPGKEDNRETDVAVHFDDSTILEEGDPVNRNVPTRPEPEQGSCTSKDFCKLFLLTCAVLLTLTILQALGVIKLDNSTDYSDDYDSPSGGGGGPGGGGGGGGI